MLTTRHSPRITLVIPAWNEERLLPRLLDTAATARTRFTKGSAAVETIVADNGSTDATPMIASDKGCRIVSVAERRIASVRNGGAAAARGEILAFADADMQLHPEAFNAIDAAMSSGRFVAGASGVSLERWSVGIAVTYAIMVPWVWLLRMDTGVVFCLRDDFVAIGGYDERRLFGEDVQLLWDLRRLGRTHGKRLVRLRGVKTVASMRKFDSYGDWHYLTRMARLLPKMLRHPEAGDEFARAYWYGDREC